MEPVSDADRDPDVVADEVADAIASNEVVLFMKGTALMPQCGYSKKAISLISQYRDDVHVVDVLDALSLYRLALKPHSGRETIPQAYVDGEFIGGSDILEQLEERDDLVDVLQA